MEILTIILAILKGIGIFLLSLLGIMLFLIVLILLWPITYQAEGSYDSSVFVRAKVSWFLGMIKVQVSYEESLNWSVKLFGFQLLPKKSTNTDSGQRIGKKKKSGKKAKEEVKEQGTETDSISGTDFNSGHIDLEPVPVQSEVSEPACDPAADSDGQTQDQSTEEKEKPDPDARIQAIIEKIISIFTKWKVKIQELCDKIKGIKDNIDHYKRILQREEVKRALVNAIRMLGKMLMHIRPRKLQVIAHVGMEDPSTTGQIMTVQGLLYPWLAQRVVIYPCFEEKKLEGKFYIAGHTILAVLLVLAIRIILNKDVLTLIRLLRKKEDTKNGRA